MFTPPPYPISRPSRLRQNKTLRALSQEITLSMNDIIYPIFIKESGNEPKPIKSMPGQNQVPLKCLPQFIREVESCGIKSIMLFGLPDKKDCTGNSNLHAHDVMPSAIKLIKDMSPELYLMSDICLCDYSDHGHCFMLNNDKSFDQNKTIEYIQKSTLVHADAGVDLVAPSGMVDGMIKAMRHALDENGYELMPILSYSNKFASSFYGPFRDALESPPSFGDRKGHQMDFANKSESLKEAAIDVSEGADILMVKPASMYLDIIQDLKTNFPMPLAAYHVSGEYSMLHAAAANGWIDLKGTAVETLTAIKRSGADMILTYFAKDLAKWLF